MMRRTAAGSIARRWRLMERGDRLMIVQAVMWVVPPLVADLAFGLDLWWQLAALLAGALPTFAVAWRLSGGRRRDPAPEDRAFVLSSMAAALTAGMIAGPLVLLFGQRLWIHAAVAALFYIGLAFAMPSFRERGRAIAAAREHIYGPDDRLTPIERWTRSLERRLRRSG